MIRNLYWEISQIRWIRNRNRRILGDRLERTRLPSISKDQKEMIRSIWGDVHVNMKWIVYYNMFREKGMAWTPYYVPANLHYGVVDMFYSNYDRCRVIEDKNLNSMLYGDVKQPDTILRSVKNGNSGGLLLMDRYYNILDERQALHILSTTETLICKPAILSGGGEKYYIYGH